MQRIIGAISATVFALTVTACGSSSTASGPAEDAGAILACDHFRNIMHDVASGILTDAELRDKMKQVNTDAQVATTDRIAPQALAMLGDVTQGDNTAFLADAVAFSDACKTIDH